MKKALLLIGISLLVAIFLPGCLDGDKTVVARFDKEKDALCILTVWQNIRAEEQNGQYDPSADLAHLETLYKNRDHLIFKPFEFLDLFSENAILRLPDNQYADIDLGRATESVAEKSPVDLDKIKIVPGQFFLREPGNLCYYHQVVIPGAQIDQYFKAASLELCESLATAVKGEIERRALEGFTPDWDKYSKKLLATFEAAIKNAIEDGPEPDALDSNMPFSQDTLKLILEAATQKQIAFERDGGGLTLSIPMTPDDSAKTLKTLQDVQDLVKNLAKTLKPVDKDAQQQAVFFQKLAEVPRVSKELNSVTIQFDLAGFINAFASPTDPSKPHEKTQIDHAAEMAKLAEARMTINKNITMKSVVDQFQAGTLSANPTNPAIKPGEGLRIEK